MFVGCCSTRRNECTARLRYVTAREYIRHAVHKNVLPNRSETFDASKYRNINYKNNFKEYSANFDFVIDEIAGNYSR